MARSFIAANKQYLDVASSPVAAGTMSIALWYCPTTIAASRLISISDGFLFTVNSLEIANSSGQISARTDAGGAIVSTTSLGMVAGCWEHTAGTFIPGNRIGYLNGISATADTAGNNPTGLNHVTIGGRPGGTQTVNGIIAYPAIWNAVLTPGEIKLLACGVPPTQVRPQNLVAFWNLNTPGLVTEFGGNPFTGQRYDLSCLGTTGVPSPASNPPMLLPRSVAQRRFYSFAPSADVSPILLMSPMQPPINSRF